MINTIIFDRDGVLVDSASIHIESVERAFRKLGIYIDEEDKKYIVSRHPRDYVHYFLEKYKFEKEEFLKKQEVEYRELFSSREIKIIEKMTRIVKTLKERGYCLGLATSSDKKTTKIVLEKAGLVGCFDAITTIEECKFGKPHPEPYLITAKKLNVASKDCLVIEDSETGVLSAKNAGMKCIAVPNDFTKHHNFSKADLILNEEDNLLEEVNYI